MLGRMCVLSAAVAVVGGCNNGDHMAGEPTRGEMNSYMVNSFYEEQARNGLVVQRTVFDHHFLPQTAVLDERGYREVEVLASHYRKHPGTLTVQRADAGDELYQKRVATVRRVLADAGVAVERVEFVDGLPGGDGMSSRRVNLAFDQEQKSPTKTGRENKPLSGTSSKGVER